MAHLYAFLLHSEYFNVSSIRLPGSHPRFLSTKIRLCLKLGLDRWRKRVKSEESCPAKRAYYLDFLGGCWCSVCNWQSTDYIIRCFLWDSYVCEQNGQFRNMRTAFPRPSSCSIIQQNPQYARLSLSLLSCKLSRLHSTRHVGSGTNGFNGSYSRASSSSQS